MLKQENLAANFCGLLASQGFRESANEFRILGQERDGTILASFISKSASSGAEISMVGCYNPKEKSFEILKKFNSRINIIQASVNTKKTLLIVVVKDQIITDNCETEESEKKFAYKPFLAEIRNAKALAPHSLLDFDSSRQVMVQFLWPKQSKNPCQDKFLVMVHEEGIYLHTVKTQKVDDENSDDNWQVDKSTTKIETIVKSFVWSQWNPKLQSLFYIHLKQSTRISLEKEEDDKVTITTLSAFQFHDDLPTETVLNIPLNLPKIPSSSKASQYEDDTIPLRIHDASLNLVIVADEDKGMLFICYYYLYQPMKQAEENSASISEVHFAYTVTMVHSSLAVHCIVPGVPWEKAKLMKPTFTLIDSHMLVYQAGIFINLLDIGLNHEPCAHISALPFTRQNNVTHLVPCFGHISYDSATLDLISLQMPKSHLIDTFKLDKSLDNRLSIIHYFLAHNNDLDIFTELLSIIMESPLDLDTVSLLKEALVAGTYSTLKKGLSQDAMSLIKLLPLTTCNTSKPLQAKVGGLTVGLSHENLHNTAMMLLSPQQRLNPYRQDTWTRLYERLNDDKDCKKRFSCDQVTSKLNYSLEQYQPEALSRCSTPQTPSGSQMMMGDINQISSASASRRNSNDVLPFIEFETCTASIQEHVISVNLRELSMHLVKNSVKQVTGFRWLKDYEPTAPTFVHAVSTRYVSAQLEVSRLLCVFLCRAAGIDARVEPDRGSTLIDRMSFAQRLLLFLTLERYVLAVQSMSFPLPQGFSSFFTYLGYQVLPYDKFVEYARRNVLEIQIDVMRIIMQGIPDDKAGTERKLSLLSLSSRSRARRCLNTWNHPQSLRIRASDHAANVLSGNSSGRSMSTTGSSQSSSLDSCLHTYSIASSRSDPYLLMDVGPWNHLRRSSSAPQLSTGSFDFPASSTSSVNGWRTPTINSWRERCRQHRAILIITSILLFILLFSFVFFIIFYRHEFAALLAYRA